MSEPKNEAVKQNTDDGIVKDINFWCPPRVHCKLWSPCRCSVAFTGFVSWESHACGHPWLVLEMTDVEVADA